jgi:hypothetical protein
MTNRWLTVGLALSEAAWQLARVQRRRRSNTEGTEVCITEGTEIVFPSVVSVATLCALRVTILILLVCTMVAPVLRCG